MSLTPSSLRTVNVTPSGAPRPLFVVTLMTPLPARAPYNEAPAAPFTTSTRPMSPGLMSEHDRLVADGADTQGHRLPRHPRGRNHHGVHPGAVGERADTQLGYLHRGRRERLAAVVDHAAAHHRLLSCGLGSRRAREQHSP